MKTKNRATGMLRAAAVLLAGFALAITAFSTCLAGAELTVEQRQQIEALARYAQFNDDPIDGILRKYGFPPADWLQQDWRGWSTWTASEKLRAAYFSVDHADSAIQAKDLLRLVASELAERNAAILKEPDLAKFLTGGPIEYKSFKFAFLSHDSVSHGRLPDEMARVVERIAFHAESMRVIGPIAYECCAIKADEAKLRSLRAKGLSQYFEDILVHSPVPPELAEKIAKMADYVVQRNASLAFDEAFQKSHAFLLKRTRTFSQGDIADIPPVIREDIKFKDAPNPDSVIRSAGEMLRNASKGNSDGLSVGQMPAEAAEDAALKKHLAAIADSLDDHLPPGLSPSASPPLITPGLPKPDAPRSPSARLYEAYRTANYGTSESKASSFRGMRMSGGGFGGVIYGAEVRSNPKLPKVVSVTFIPRTEKSKSALTNELWGHLELIFADGSRGFSVPVRAQHALAAQRLVFELDALKGGRGVGLVGYQGQLVSAHVDVNTGKVRQDDEGLVFVVSPAIDRTTLARSLMVVDATGFVSSYQHDLLSILAKHERDATKVDEIQQWFSIRKGQYKFTDVPAVIERSPDGLVTAVPRNPHQGKLHEFEQPGIFLDFQALAESKRQQAAIDKKMNKLLPVVLPLLLSASRDFREANDFVEVLDIFRYVKASGGIMTHAVNTAENQYPYGTLFAAGSNSYRFGPSPIMLNLRLLEDVKTVGANISSGGPSALNKLNEKMYEWGRGLTSYQIASGLLDDARENVVVAHQSSPQERMVEGIDKLSFPPSPLPKNLQTVVESLGAPAGTPPILKAIDAAQDKAKRRAQLLFLLAIDSDISDDEYAKISSLFDAQSAQKIKSASERMDRAADGSEAEQQLAAQQYVKTREELAQRISADLDENIASLDKQAGANGVLVRAAKFYNLWLSYVKEVPYLLFDSAT